MQAVIKTYETSPASMATQLGELIEHSITRVITRRGSKMRVSRVSRIVYIYIVYIHNYIYTDSMCSPVPPSCHSP